VSDSQKKKDGTISGLVRTDLSEIESQQYGGRSREQVWEWFCEKHDLTLAKTTFFNLLYRARKRAEKEQMKVARIAAISVPASPIAATQQPTLTQPKPSKKEVTKHVEHVEEVPDGRRENSLPENPTGQDRLRAALNTPTPTLDFGGSRRRGR
jgi:hypothetical protein